MAKKMKAWLKPNPLTADKSDFIAVIESFGSVAPNDIINALVAEGMELKPETVLDVITRYNRKSIELVLGGHSVNTGIVHMRPVIKGVFRNKTWNPAEHHLYVAIIQGADIRTALAETTVNIMGEHPDPASLFNITDLSTGMTDGSLTRGFNAELKGTYIKIAGDDPSCGIWFRDAATAAETQLGSQYISLNDPSRLMIIVPPTMASGAYELYVRTQYTVGKQQLKQPRTATLPYMVEII